MSDQEPPPGPLQSFGLLDVLSSRSADDYAYNYTYVAPLAMAQSVPRADKPSLPWMLRVVWQCLRVAKNRVTWALNTGRAIRPGDEVLTFSGEGEEPGSTTMNLEHLGLPSIDIVNAEFDEEPPMTAIRVDGDGTGDEIMSFSSNQDTVREGLTTQSQAAEIAMKMIAFGIHNPFDVLETVLRSLVEGPAGRPTSLDDYRELFATLPKPWFMNRPDDDELFAWMRVAGWNPLVIERISALPTNFPVTEDMFATAMVDGFDSLSQAANEGRLYLANYAALSNVMNGNFPVGPKYCFAPMALFALPRGTGPRRLRPVAIQCGQDPRDYRIYTPADGEMWQKAKICVSCADANHHEAVSHLTRTHLFIEPFVVATHRNLGEHHPIGKLLIPHFEGTLNINSEAQKKMLRKGFAVDRLMAGTIEASRKVAVETMAATSFNDGFLPKALAMRGVLDENLEYPYRDDAMLVWQAIERWVTAYVGMYYRSDAQVSNDDALRNWALELVSKDGGRVLGFGEDGRGKLTTTWYLVKALTMIIFTASAQHAAVNFPQADFMTYTPAVPLAAYRSAPISAAESANNPVMDMLAPMEMAMLQVEFLSILGGVYHTKLGAYPTLWFTDVSVLSALAQFQQELVNIGQTVEARNRTRFGPYPYFLPDRIPQSINS
ncbi:MAG TPA: lipoxygenase family protein [Polyangium sp.]|nr:lipoxygenase family protein [Polyangium sp.]